MNLENYQIAATRTLVSINPFSDRMHMAQGLITELGEITDIYKRNLAYGKAIDVTNLKEEIGDFMWYLVNMGTLLDIVIDRVDRKSVMPMTGDKHGFNFCAVLTYHNNEICSKVLRSKDPDGTDFRLRPGMEWELSYLISVIEQFCKVNNFSLEEICFMNIKKLYTRFPDKFSKDKALVRDLEAERKTLENGN